MSSNDISIPAREQTPSVGTVQHWQQALSHQQPIYISNLPHSPPLFPSHQRTASLGGIRQSPASFPIHQQSPPYNNQHPLPHQGTHHAGTFYNHNQYHSQALALPPPTYYSSYPSMEEYPAASSPTFYNSNPQPPSSTVSAHHYPDPFVSPTGSGYHHRTTSSPMQPSYQGSPPFHQARPPIQQPSTPATGPPFRLEDSNPVEGSTAGSPRDKSMKYITCYFWKNKEGGCRFTEEECLYAHRDEGCLSVAGKPVHIEPGMPAVAGKNAEKMKPEYINWRHRHGNGNYSSPKTPFPPRVQAQIQNLHNKHDPAFAADPRVKDLQQVLRQAEKDSMTKRQDEVVEAAEHQARLDADIKVREELLERLGGRQTLPGMEASTTEVITRGTRASSDPVSSPHSNKSTKVAVEVSGTPAVETTQAMKDLIAQNQVLRNTVQDLAQVVSTVMTSNVAMRASRVALHDDMFDRIMKLPEDDQEFFLRVFERSTKVSEVRRPAEEEAKRTMDAVRNKMVESGQGGLLTVWDRDFCKSTPRSL